MICPKIQSLQTTEEHILLVKFDNQQVKKYDIKPLLEQEHFFPLSNTALFKCAQIENGGYAIYWNEEIDLSEYEIWIHGTLVND